MVAVGELTDEQQIAAIMAATGMDEARARFILAIERGEIEGDVVDLPKESE